ncbi:hypothetical protein K435DRAFT_873204 [Dendrothele bispora CBS 962.96]|uniref:Uncharacterized protein n=1 Tax=Dendrothele bispora (strain CBS 962.96) TaxID=1314807 RepID=A0A4S8L037_DENBC|nr:hypothetical protein K435DRAFT_873204 [Dendrothele bispora CBS 962.96]
MSQKVCSTRSSIKIDNYIHKMAQGQKHILMYSPFICQCPDDWSSASEIYIDFSDFCDCINKSTFGPYSFQVFVVTGWSCEHMQSFEEEEDEDNLDNNTADDPIIISSLTFDSVDPSSNMTMDLDPSNSVPILVEEKEDKYSDMDPEDMSKTAGGMKVWSANETSWSYCC